MIIALVILMFALEAILEIFQNGPRNFEMWSDEVDDICASAPFPSSTPHPREVVRPYTHLTATGPYISRTFCRIEFQTFNSPVSKTKL
ncbi:hypothetical protein AVEN_129034-1 [Araneus ventricosus]|uniref:Secreted protein n=1 Tax=Araneus ventricosus TaxID=182803 RepID=A0A4Y2HK92_ARAVE|nr:hypothetical protein AVEN_129034-1 [Araneus ventricosus]